MSTITVTTSAQLNSAIKTAHAGDQIQVADGTYAGLDFRNLNFSTPVTISALGDNAVFKSFNILNSSGLSFKNLEFSNAGQTGYYAWNVNNSSNIHFDHLSVHGSLDNNSQNDIEGIGINKSSNVSITNSEFQQLYRTIAVGSDTNVTISGNSFHDIARSGVYGADSSNVTISHNNFTSFHPKPGDHMDAIAFYNTTTGGVSHDISITDNVIVRGDGQPTQGIFMASPGTSDSFDRLTIANNMIVGEGYNGLAVAGATHLTIKNNVVESFPGATNISWIDVRNTVGAQVVGNSASLIGVVASHNNVALVNSGNTIIDRVIDQGADGLQTWLTAHQGDLSNMAQSIMDIAWPGGTGSSGGGAITPVPPPTTSGWFV